MANTITTTQMGLVLPIPGKENGPDYALDLNNALTKVDSHDHTTGNGAPLTPSSLNISSDLPMNDHNLTETRSVRLYDQTRTFDPINNDPLDKGSVYRVGTDLYYSNGNGSQVQITNGAGLAGTPGSIGGLTSPASATYASNTFTFKSAATTAANLDGGSIVLRNNVANSKALTVSPPNAMGADYGLTMPTIPATQSIMALDTSGNMSAPYTVDNSTIGIIANQIKVKDSGITATQIANATITGAKIAAGTITASNITSGTITGTQIATGGIAASNIASSSLTNTQISGAADITRTKLHQPTSDITALASGSYNGVILTHTVSNVSPGYLCCLQAYIRNTPSGITPVGSVDITLTWQGITLQVVSLSPSMTYPISIFNFIHLGSFTNGDLLTWSCNNTIVVNNFRFELFNI